MTPPPACAKPKRLRFGGGRSAARTPPHAKRGEDEKCVLQCSLVCEWSLRNGARSRIAAIARPDGGGKSSSLEHAHAQGSPRALSVAASPRTGSATGRGQGDRSH